MSTTTEQKLAWPEFAERAIDVPFVDRGRDWSGWDCWGLCVVAYRELFGMELPDVDYASAFDSRGNGEILAREREQFRATATPRIGDIALMLRGRYPIHAGLVGIGGKILHCEEKIGTVHEPIQRLRIEGFYQHAGRHPQTA